MANRVDKAALFIYIAANYIKAVLNFISPAKHISALTDLWDTLLARYATVADMTALNALGLGTDFGEGDIRKVTVDADGVTGYYKYVYNEDVADFAWVKIGSNVNNVNRVEVATNTLRDALIVGTDFEIGDFITVSDNGYGEKIKYKYMYDSATSGNKWVAIGILSQY